MNDEKSIFCYNYLGGHRTPNRRERTGRGISESNMGKRDNDCFGSGIEDFHIHEEFDFEKNLALFDKVYILLF